jgi:hypothetical protein
MALDTQRLDVHRILRRVATVVMVLARRHPAVAAEIRRGGGNVAGSDGVVYDGPCPTLRAFVCLDGGEFGFDVGLRQIGGQCLAILRRVSMAGFCHDVSALGSALLVAAAAGSLACVTLAIRLGRALSVASAARLAPAGEPIACAGLPIEVTDRLRLTIGGAGLMRATLQSARQERIGGGDIFQFVRHMEVYQKTSNTTRAH